jgi:DNA-directed RNA polymerase subunit omega
MMVKPTVTELLTKADNRFELVIMTAKRARQLVDGATPLTKKIEDSNVTLAADEIAEDKVKMKE